MESSWDVVTGLLTVGVAYYAIHAQAKRETARAIEDRRERRRERLQGLYAEWANNMMALGGRTVAASQLIEDGLRSPHAIGPQAVDIGRELSADCCKFGHEISRCAQLIMIEEGDRLTEEVEKLTQEWIDLSSATLLEAKEMRVNTEWCKAEFFKLKEKMRSVLQSKKVALQSSQRR
jgi:hypothetical protein